MLVDTAPFSRKPLSLELSAGLLRVWFGEERARVNRPQLGGEQPLRAGALLTLRQLVQRCQSACCEEQGADVGDL